MGLLPNYEACFFCGRENEGLRMKVRVKDGSVFSEFLLDRKFQGYDNVAHGGIVAGILDEVMWWAIFTHTHKICYTRRMETEFLRPVNCGALYRVEGRLGDMGRSGVHASATIRDVEGRTAAKGSGLFRVAQDIAPAAFLAKLDFAEVSPDVEASFRRALTDR